MRTTQNRALVLFSGGIDSTACIVFFRQRGFAVRGLFIDYGQAAAQNELSAVTALSRELGIAVARHSYRPTDTFGPGEIVGRNAFLISAALLTDKGESELIAVGLHAGTPYYDCSPAFVGLMSQVVAETTTGRTRLFAPFVEWTKDRIFDYLAESGVNPTLTYSCEKGSRPPCGVCASCVDLERINARKTT